MTAIGFLGCGEAGQMMASTLRRDHPDLTIYAYDKLRENEQACAQGPLAHIINHLPSAQALAEASSVIISVVTADQSEQAARSVVPYITSAHIFADGNSVSPGTKQQSAQLFEASGCSYIDMAIMAPITPDGHKTALLLSGKNASEIAPLFESLGFCFDWEGDEIGQACVVKMLRSVLIKGMESLICEAVTAAHGLGLNQRILTSAGKTLGIADMPALADYVMERVAVHGRRRAAEMREVAKTLSELGLSNDMASASAVHQDRVADMHIPLHFDKTVPKDQNLLAQLMQEHQKNG